MSNNGVPLSCGIGINKCHRKRTIYFDRTSGQSAIVSIALSCTLNIVTSTSRLGVTENLCTICTSLKYLLALI